MQTSVFVWVNELELLHETMLTDILTILLNFGGVFCGVVNLCCIFYPQHNRLSFFTSIAISMVPSRRLPYKHCCQLERDNRMVALKLSIHRKHNFVRFNTATKFIQMKRQWMPEESIQYYIFHFNLLVTHRRVTQWDCAQSNHKKIYK